MDLTWRYLIIFEDLYLNVVFLLFLFQFRLKYFQIQLFHHLNLFLLKKYRFE